MNLNLIQRINSLWEPVYPYLAHQIAEIYGRQDGEILEIGPFSGVIFFLPQRNIGHSFTIAAFPEGMGDFFREEVEKRNLEKLIKVMDSDPSLIGLENCIDLAIFRGAFFFPSLFEVRLSAIHRVLRERGTAFVGGGFGKFTPDSVIREIKKISRDLNLQIGKVEVSKDRLQHELQMSQPQGEIKIITEGGLWVILKR